MATFITSDRTTTYSLGGGGDIFLLDGVTARPATGNAFGGDITSSTSLTIAGDVFASDSFVSIFTMDANFKINITSTGTVVANGDGFNGANDFDFELINAGEISVRASAVYTFNENVTVTNTGSILSNGPNFGFNGTFSNGNSTATKQFTLTNTDTIINTNNGAVVEYSNTVVDVTNAGFIQSNGTFAIDTENSFLYVQNSGSIVGGVNNAGVSTTIILNSGDISGVFTLGDDADEITNSGEIAGSIFMEDGDDIYFGEQGLLTYGSEIHLGAGDDELDGGVARERVFDGAGDDDVFTNGGNDSIRAGSGANNYDGGEGQDYLSYFDFNSRVRIDLEAETTSGGGSGNAASNDTFTSIERVGGTNGGGDTLLGTSEANSMFGFGGEDKLYGRGGNDKLVGGDGDDFFDGGGGTDRLFGGADADTFHFDRGEGDDLVMDFENNIDTIEFDNFSGSLSNSAFLAQYATAGAGNVYFDFGSDGSLIVFDTTIGQLLNDIDIV